MKLNKKYPTTNYNGLISKYYFIKVAKEIIQIGNLENINTILDYGCGEKIFSQLMPNKKIYNYDIKPEYNEVDNVKKYYNSDIIIFNHVWMYIEKTAIESILKDIKNLNVNTKIILSLGKQNFISKIAMFLAGKPNAHNNTVSSYNSQIEILKKYCTIKKIKKNIFFMTDIFFAEFK